MTKHRFIQQILLPELGFLLLWKDTTTTATLTKKTFIRGGLLFRFLVYYRHAREHGGVQSGVMLEYESPTSCGQQEVN